MAVVKKSLTGRSTSTSSSIWQLTFAHLWALLEPVWHHCHELFIDSSDAIYASIACRFACDFLEERRYCHVTLFCNFIFFFIFTVFNLFPIWLTQYWPFQWCRHTRLDFGVILSSRRAVRSALSLFAELMSKCVSETDFFYRSVTCFFINATIGVMKDVLPKNPSRQGIYRGNEFGMLIHIVHQHGI